jgi:putative two-component system response regulator
LKNPSATVLVVDDDADLVGTVCELLRDAGYDAGAAESADAALFYVARAAPLPDLILLDLRMPGLSVDRFVSELKKRHHLARIRIVLMTAATRREIPDGLSVDGVLLKPFGKDVLLAMVKQLVATNQRR